MRTQAIIAITAYMVSAIISVWLLSYFTIKAKKTQLFRSFFVLLLLQIIWLLTKVFRVLSPTVEISWIMTVIQYCAICFIGAGYLNFSYRYYKDEPLNLVIRYIIFAVSFINFLAVITNPMHLLFFSDYDMISSCRGPLFYLHTATSYLFLFLGLWYMFKGVHDKVLANKRGMYSWYYVGLGTPMLINVLEVLDLIPFEYDLTPIGFITTYLVYAMVAYRHQFMDVSKVAKYDIYENLQEGIVVFDHNQQIETVNHLFYELLPDSISVYEGMHLKAFVQALRDIMEDAESVYRKFTGFIYSKDTRIEMEVTVAIDQQLNHYQIEFQKSNLSKGKLILRIMDINRYIHAIEQLEIQNESLQCIHNSLSEELAVKKKLLIARERNRVSKEVHDILGHSLTVVISLMQAAKQVALIKPTQAKEKIEMALKTTRYNYNNLKKSLSNPSEIAMTGEQLIQDINRMVNSVEKAGTEVELITRNYDIAFPSHYYDAVYHMCQEGLTNAIRHGKAKSVTIALRFTTELMDLMIIDNGTGADTFEMGNGLKYMESKVKEFNGYFSCGSLGREGFSIHVKLPLQLKDVK